MVGRCFFRRRVAEIEARLAGWDYVFRVARLVGLACVYVAAVCSLGLEADAAGEW